MVRWLVHAILCRPFFLLIHVVRLWYCVAGITPFDAWRKKEWGMLPRLRIYYVISHIVRSK